MTLSAFFSVLIHQLITFPQELFHQPFLNTRFRHMRRYPLYSKINLRFSSGPPIRPSGPLNDLEYSVPVMGKQPRRRSRIASGIDMDISADFLLEEATACRSSAL